MAFRFPLVDHQFYMQLVVVELANREMEMAVVVISMPTKLTMVGQIIDQLQLQQIQVLEAVGSGLTLQSVILKLVHQELLLFVTPQQGVLHSQ